MKNEVIEKDDIVIIALSGKIMGGPEAGEINDQINNFLDKHKTKIIIDLLNVEWMNSSGLGILIGAITTLKNNGGKLVLANASDRVEKLLNITKTSGVFIMANSIESAIKSF